MTGAARILRADDSAISEAAEILCAGGLVAFPTETVYGLGADASNDEAVAGIFAAKDRPSFNPLIVHVADAAAAAALVAFTPVAKTLAAALWPGALTLVLPRRPDCGISLLCSAGLDSLGVRTPAHPVAQRLLAACERPLAAPSANRSGRISPTTAAHVAESLGGRVPLILDGGPCALGLESTVLDLTGPRPLLLRPGGITEAEIEAVVGPLDSAEESAPERPRSPGQLESHYAPSRPLRLEATSVGPREALLAFGPSAPAGAAAAVNLSPRGDLTEAAARLFAALHELDRPDLEAIAVMPIPEDGLGRAINDRLRRAAAPRS
ncbi:MAG: L-threonylcarbamoyladenylate synthase [Kiloniellales bacterium]|nr:L-threonylcarbamoyladenylate synthase [Kiloniellales bacterium]